MKHTAVKSSVAMACAMMSSLLFGLSFIFVKQSVNEVSTFTLLSWRFLFAFFGMCICVLFGLLKINLRGKPLKPLLLIALFQPILYYIVETWGIALTIVTVILSALMLKEPPTRRQTLSIVLSVAGIFIMVLIKGLSASLNPIGYLLLFITISSAGLYVIYSRKAAAYTSTEKTFIMSAAGALVFTVFAVVEHAAAGTFREFIILPFTNHDFLISLLYLSVACSVIATMLRNYSISEIGATRTASFAVLTTVVSVVAGVVFLNEPFSFAQGVATVLVLAGVYGANHIPKKAVPLNSPAFCESLPEKEKGGGV